MNPPHLSNRASVRNIGAFTLLVSLALIMGAVLPLQGQTLYVPALQAIENAELGLALVNPTLTEAQVILTARTYAGAIIQGNDITNPVRLILSASGQKALRSVEIFGAGISRQTGWLEISASTPELKGIFAAYDSGLSFVDGAELATRPSSRIVFAKVSPAASSPSRLTLVNTASEVIHATISLYENSGQLADGRGIVLPAYSGFAGAISDLIPSAAAFEGYAVVESDAGPSFPAVESLIGFETYRNRSDMALIRAFPKSAQMRTGYLAHFASHGGYTTRLTLINVSDEPQVLRITAEALEVGGTPWTPSSLTVRKTLLPHARLEERVEHMFDLPGDALTSGYIRFEAQGSTAGVIAFMDCGSTDQVALSASEAQAIGYSQLVFSHVAEGGSYYTGLALLNTNNTPSTVTLDMFDSTGSRTGSTIVNLNPGERKARLLGEFFQRAISQMGGYVHLAATRPIFALEFFGSRNSSTFLANVPAQNGGSTFYVNASSGSDSNSGSPSSPWRTIQKAVDTLRAGNTLLVMPGTYNEHVRITRSGSPGSPITLQAQGTDTIMQGFTINASYVRINGFEITNSRTNFPDSTGVFISGSENEVSGCYIHDILNNAGVVVFGGSDANAAATNNNVVKSNTIVRARIAGIRVEGRNNIIEGNDISRTLQNPPGSAIISGADADGIRFFGTGNVIRKNYIHDIHLTDVGNHGCFQGEDACPHIDVFQTWGPASDIVIEGNVAQWTDDGLSGQVPLINPQWAEIEAKPGLAVTNLIFRNNVFMHETTKFGPMNFDDAQGGPMTNIAIVNNTFVRLKGPGTGGGEYAILMNGGGGLLSNVTIQNNVFYDCGSSSSAYVSVRGFTANIGYNGVYMSSGSAPPGGPRSNDQWMVEPKFVNFAGKDFHLQASSPLIDTGATLSAVSDDQDGTPRPQGPKHDIGAYEFF